MLTESQKLWKARLISIGYSFVTLLGSLLLFLLSADGFREWVFANVGNTTLAGFIILIAPEIIKHLRNVKKLGKLGARVDDSDFIII